MKRLLLAATLIAASLSGCSGMNASACASWIEFRDAAEMAGVADLVIVGEELGKDGVTQSMGVNATAHSVRVDKVLKGEFDDAEIRVVSLPDACSGGGGLYPEGDPIEVEGTAEFFLLYTDGNWTSLTPFQSAVVIAIDGTLPWDPAVTPSPTPAP